MINCVNSLKHRKTRVFGRSVPIWVLMVLLLSGSAVAGVLLFAPATVNAKVTSGGAPVVLQQGDVAFPFQLDRGMAVVDIPLYANTNEVIYNDVMRLYAPAQVSSASIANVSRTNHAISVMKILVTDSPNAPTPADFAGNGIVIDSTAKSINVGNMDAQTTKYVHFQITVGGAVLDDVDHIYFKAAG